LKHLLVMILFAALVAIVFGVVARNSEKERMIYGLKIFAEFIGIGLALAWVLYFFPF
jgi:hypothetical protein